MPAHPWTTVARRVALVALAGASLAACATAGGPGPVASTRPHERPRDDGSPRHAQGGPPSSATRGTMRPYQVNGVWYTPQANADYDEQGIASWYGAQFHNHQTADGEIFDMDAPSGAHKTLPLPSIVEVTNLDNGRKLRVRINDRGPFVGGRIIDLSREGAKQLGFYDKGVARVRVRYIGPASLERPGDGVRYARADPPPPARPQPPPVHDDPPAPIQVTGPPHGWSIQAGAYSDRGNAERAAERLADEGAATIEPLQRNGATLYRVLIRGDGDDAEDLRQRISDAGFPGAKVIGAN